jgi:hypothetical protein
MILKETPPRLEGGRGGGHWESYSQADWRFFITNFNVSNFIIYGGLLLFGDKYHKIDE